MTEDWSAVRLIAHRCGGNLAPENSLAGLAAAKRAGFGAVEFDVMLTADGVPVVIHDETLERTTDGVGEVAAHTLAELQQLRCGKGWAGALADEPIPTLRQLLQCCHALRLLPNLEIKPSTGTARRTGEVVAAQALAEWLRLGARPQDLLLSSFSTEALAIARDVAPALPRAWLVERLPGEWTVDYENLAARAIHCAADKLDAAQAAELSRAGVPVRCYTVNAVAQAERLFQQGVSSIFTDALQIFTANQ